MTSKKKIMSITAGAIIASAFVATDEAEAASYKVKSGDTLWEIAQKFDTSVAALKSINNLSSNLIFPNQILETEPSNANTPTINRPAENTSNKAATYTVKRGDTLSGIAFKHNISLAELMEWNDLDTTLIYPGDVFVVSKPGNSPNTNSEPESNDNTSKAPNEQVDSATVYTVRWGDTLSEIAYRNGVTVANLKRWNGLSSDLIFVGQKLNIGDSSNSGTSDTTPSNNNGNSNMGQAPSDVDYNVSKLISIAKGLQGVGYAWGGTSPSGFDCSGFIYYTYKKAGMDIARHSSSGYYNRSYYVNKPKVGDLVFFENTYKKGISHMGIYLGNNRFIHAGSDGVEITKLSYTYWQKHFDGFKRFY